MRPERAPELLRNMFRTSSRDAFRAAKGVSMVAVLPSRIGEGTPYNRFTSGAAIVLYLAVAKLLIR